VSDKKPYIFAAALWFIITAYGLFRILSIECSASNEECSKIMSDQFWFIAIWAPLGLAMMLWIAHSSKKKL